MIYAFTIFILNVFVTVTLSASQAQKANQEAMKWAKSLQKENATQKDWVEKVSKRTDTDSINWVKEHLKNDPQLATLKANAVEKSDQYRKKKCFNGPMPEEVTPAVYVFISFSLPLESWVSLSSELEKVGGVFVLQGIPDNSFSALSKNILLLNDLGIKVPIQINPLLFQEFDIHAVPTILVQEEEKHDKITGNISLFYALQKMASYGDTSLSKSLLLRLEGKS